MKNLEQQSRQIPGDISRKNLEGDSGDHEREESPGTNPDAQAHPEHSAQNGL
jgi:hypothetical protein